ncbi:MAG: right-handed parallel beta-helix repeat-containing protein, partial [Planctomycetota bacterium]
TYVENIDFKGNAIHVKSSAGAASTVIDGGLPEDPKWGSVVTFCKSEHADSILEGFTLTNGTGTFGKFHSQISGYYGGGICCLNSIPSLKDNIVIQNSADFGAGLYGYFAPLVMYNNVLANNAGVHEGGGICLFRSSTTIVNNQIAYNTVTSGPGGGISCTEESTPTITNNTIIGNAAAAGGGIHCLTDCDATIMDNKISDNSAVEDGGGLFIIDSMPVIKNNAISKNVARYGSGIAIWYSVHLTLENNMVSENTASQRGGGIHFIDSDTRKVRNNTICNNAAQSGGGISCSDSDICSVNNTIWGNSAASGGGLYLVNGSKPQFTNTILSKNTAAQGAEIEIRGGLKASGLFISYSCVEGGTAGVYMDPDCFINCGPGVLEVDPLLVDPEKGDFHLSYMSPCRETGDNSAEYLPETDFEGDPRVSQDFTDLGADEFHTHLYCIGDFIPGGMIKGKFAGMPGTYPVALIIGAGVMDPPLHHMWGDFYLEAPWIFVPLFPIPSHGVLAIATKLPENPVGPYEIPMQGLIGESLTNLFVLEVK